MIQGANDPRVLQVESDEGHGFQRRTNRITAQESYLAFLNRHVRKAE